MNQSSLCCYIYVCAFLQFTYRGFHSPNSSPIHPTALLRPLLPHRVAERREEVLLLLLELLLLMLLVPVVVVERGREALEVLERRRGRAAEAAAHGRQRG